MSVPAVSCIVTAWNDERYLGDAIESILAQDYPDFEVLVVDDGSTDGTADVVLGFGHRVRYVYQSNAGCSAARNTGIRETAGEFIAFLDADDLWVPQKLQSQVAAFQSRADLDACFTYAQNFWIDELKDEEERFQDHRISKPLPAYAASTLMTRRSLFDRFGWFDIEQDYGQTVEWVIRVRSAGALVDHIPDVLTRRRIHDRNRSREQSGKARDDFLHMLKTHLDRQRSQQ
jgi:glycosyltransferase involved in cell wall biosynthesis